MMATVTANGNEIEADLVRAAAEQRMLNPAETPTMGIGSDDFDYEPVSEVGEEIQEEVFLDPEEVIY